MTNLKNLLSTSSQASQKNLRNQLREARNDLTLLEQEQHAAQAVKLLKKSNFLLDANKVAVFFSADGELPTDFLISCLWQAGKQVFLPKILPGGMLQFVQYTPDSELVANRFGILEPKVCEAIQPGLVMAATDLDLVLVPLVGYDLQGNRLGMGGGFYDRTFGFKLPLAKNPTKQPLLVGWAHSVQQVAALPTMPWDVKLDGLVNENELLVF